MIMHGELEVSLLNSFATREPQQLELAISISGFIFLGKGLS